MKLFRWQIALVLTFFMIVVPGFVNAGQQTEVTGEQKLESSDLSWIKGTDFVIPGYTYVIGAGDILDVSVWKEEELTRQLTVLPDGNIVFPLIGEITASGKTINELKIEIEEKLARFVPDPVITVGAFRVNSMVIYVIGKVSRPGRYDLSSNIDVLQALAIAGGLNPFAKSKKIKIFRRSGYATEVIDFNYDEVADGENLDQNIHLFRGDTIVVN